MSVSDDLKEVLALDQGILDTFGMRVLSAEDGICELECTVPAQLVNAGGFAHGSIPFAVMDTACAYALRSAGVSGVTVHGDTNFVRGGRAGSVFVGRVEVASLTRRVATLRGTVHLREGATQVLAAHGSFVFQLRVPEPSG